MGVLCLILGLVFVAVGFGFGPAFFRSDLSLVGAFFIFLLSLVPFIATLTKLGLNKEDDGAKESEESRKELSKHLPHRDVPFYLGLGAFGVSMFFRTYIHPLYAFMSLGCFLSSYWFLHVYPVAKEVLKEPKQPPEVNKQVEK